MPDKSVYALIFTPHLHDAEVGVGGTVARWTREGKEVVLVAVTDGSCGSGNPAIKPADLVKRREAEQLAAAKVLGVKEVVFLRQPDLRLADTLELRKELCRLVLTYRPQIVVTKDPNIMSYINNPDHRILGTMVREVAWPMVLAPNVFPELLQQGLLPHHVKEVWFWGADKANYYVDITNTFDLKWQAWQCHRSQIEDAIRPPGDYQDALDRHQKWVKGFALKAAEATEFDLAEDFMRAILPPGL